MRKCSKCGKVYDDSWKVCLHCSIQLVDVSDENTVVPEVLTATSEITRGNVGRNIKQGAGCAIAGIAYLVMGVLGLIIHIWTILIAYSFAGILGAAISLMFPVLAQIFWGFKIWAHTGTIMNGYCLALIGYVVAFGAVLIGAGMLSDL